MLPDDFYGEFKMSIVLFPKLNVIDRDKNVVSYERKFEKKLLFESKLPIPKFEKIFPRLKETLDNETKKKSKELFSFFSNTTATIAKKSDNTANKFRRIKFHCLYKK